MCLVIDGIYIYTRFARVRTLILSFRASRLFFLRYFVAIFYRARSSRAKDPPPGLYRLRYYVSTKIVYEWRYTRDTLYKICKVSHHVRRLAHESAMDLVARGIEDVRAAYKKQENSRGVGWPRRGKRGERRRSTLVAYIFYGAITGNPYLRFVQFCPSVQPSLFPTFFSSPPLCLRVYARLTLSPSVLERFANDYL